MKKIALLLFAALVFAGLSSPASAGGSGCFSQWSLGHGGLQWVCPGGRVIRSPSYSWHHGPHGRYWGENPGYGYYGNGYGAGYGGGYAHMHSYARVHSYVRIRAWSRTAQVRGGGNSYRADPPDSRPTRADYDLVRSVYQTNPQ